MKKSFILMMMAALAMTSCELKMEKSEELVQKTTKVSAFERVEIFGSPSVCYTQADSVSVRIEGPKSQVERIEAKVKDNVLSIRHKGRKLNIFDVHVSWSDEVCIYVTSPDLIGVDLRGSGDFECKNMLDTDTLLIRLHGSGDVKFDSVLCDRISVEQVGSGDVFLKDIQAQQANMELVGSGDLKARMKHTALTDISLRGSGDIEVSFSNCTAANCSVQGSGDVKLKGQLQQLNQSTYGSGSIDTEELSVQK
jgi:hypothetical protein